MNRPFEFAGFFLVRTPLLAFGEFRRLAPHSANLDAMDSTDAYRAAAGQLEEFYRKPAVREALYIASPSIFERAMAWDPSKGDSKSRKIGYTLYKYAARMTHRCTPFGAFAGVSVGTAVASGDTDREEVQFLGIESYRRRCRIDMGAIGLLVRHWMSNASVRQALSYRLNPTLRRFGDRMHYLEPADIELSPGRFQFSFALISTALDAVTGAYETTGDLLSFTQLGKALAPIAEDASEEERNGFIDELIESRLLLPALEPAPTGGDPLRQLIAALDRKAIPDADELFRLIDAFAVLDARPIGAGRQTLIAVESAVRRILNRPQARNVVQTDLFKPVAAATVSARTIERVSEIAELCIALGRPPSDKLRKFKEAFRERYGERQVPLVEALDAEHGVPFGATTGDDLPLLADLPLPARGAVDRSMESTANGLDGYLLALFERACREDLQQVELDAQVVAILLEKFDRLRTPSSFYLLTKILTGAAAGIDREPTLVIKAAGGPSAANLIARFCSGDARIEALTKEMLLREEQRVDEDVIVVEIVHSPSGRVGNVLSRPGLRRHEMPLYGRAQASMERRCELADIYVSIEAGAVRLRSKRLGKRIVPRLTSAHNYSNESIPLYEFLGTLQHEDGSIGALFWPSTFHGVARLPRITYKGCILSPQHWNLSAPGLQELQRCSLDGAVALIGRWRISGCWPRFMELVDSDAFLVIDMDNPVAVECLAQELKGRRRATLIEAFVPDGDTSFAHGPEGSFCSEVVLPFLRSPRERNDRDAGDLRQLRRRIDGGAASAPACGGGVGSHWLFVKIYCGTEVLDRILTDHLHSVIEASLANGCVDRWFFLRYADPHHHLRLRLHGEPSVLWGPVLAALRSSLDSISADGYVWKVDAGHYEPEIERYGGPDAIEIAEGMFHADSECALQLLQQEQFRDPQERWLYIALNVDLLWESFGYDESSRADVYERNALNMRRGLGDAADIVRRVKFALDKKFRVVRGRLESLVWRRQIQRTDPIWEAFARRSARLAPLVTKLRGLDARDARLSRAFEDIVASHVHMSIDRLCTSSNAQQEHAIYELLTRMYRSASARSAAPMTGRPVHEPAQLVAEDR